MSSRVKAARAQLWRFVQLYSDHNMGLVLGGQLHNRSAFVHVGWLPLHKRIKKRRKRRLYDCVYQGRLRFYYE